jgi:hypothetical protein
MEPKRISPHILYSILGNISPFSRDPVILIDIRSAELYSKGCILDAVPLGTKSLEEILKFMRVIVYSNDGKYPEIQWISELLQKADRSR